MRIFLILGLLAAGCTKANPNSCCTTQDQCTQVGLKDITGCKSGNVCDPYGACVKPQCAASTDCTSPDAPICLGGLCVAKCTADADCAGIAGTLYCASDGECVACKDDSSCSGDSPICDATSHACRACAADTECASGVCLEQQGTCADSSRVVFLQSDGRDNASCDASAPCGTFAGALQLTSTQRDVIRLRGVAFDVGQTAVNFSLRTLFVDGADTVMERDTAGPIFTVGSGNITVEGLTLVASGTSQAISISGGTVDMTQVRLLAPVSVSGGTVTIEHSTMTGSVACSGGANLSLLQNTLYASFGSSGCAATVDRNRIIDAATSCSVDGVSSVVENNLFVARDSFADGLVISNGATARFNTLVNLSGVDSGAMSLTCNGMVTATSNIVAWHTSHAPCASKYSLFDEVAGSQPGTGNVTGNAASLFVNLAGGDFHLAVGSLALGAGESVLPVMTDIDGSPRPNPIGSSPDIGAYEAP